MSTVANFFIEVKDKEGKWNFVKAYYPFKEKTITKCSDGKITEERTEPYALTTDGEGLSKFICLWKQGHIRDLFSHSFDCAFTDRGLPNDLSEEVNSHFENLRKEVEEENARYFEKYGEKKTWGGKWWWGETYATLGELEEQFDKEFKKWKESLTKCFEQKYLYSELIQKMNEVISVVKKTKNNGDNTEENEYVDQDIEYYLNDDIYDLFNLWAFIIEIEDITENMTDYQIYDTRVIAYCE